MNVDKPSHRVLGIYVPVLFLFWLSLQPLHKLPMHQQMLLSLLPANLPCRGPRHEACCEIALDKICVQETTLHVQPKTFQNLSVSFFLRFGVEEWWSYILIAYWILDRVIQVQSLVWVIGLCSWVRHKHSPSVSFDLPRCKMSTANLMLGGDPAMHWYPIRRGKLHATKTRRGSSCNVPLAWHLIFTRFGGLSD